MKIKNNKLIYVSINDISVDGKFVVPDNITEIGYSAFFDCISLKEVVISDSVTKIGDSAFRGCSSLKDIIIPDSVTKIGHAAFWRCSSLEKVVIPEGVSEIKNYTFENCSSLKKIVIPDSVTEIGDFVFWRCSSLKEIKIPDSVTEIGNFAFNNCKLLSTIHWEHKTYSVRCIDGFCMHILKEKQWESYNIVKCSYFPEEIIVYVAEKDNIFAHGKTIREAVSDLQFKIRESMDVSEHIARIAQQGFMNANDYRLLTGACRQGTDRFLSEHNLTWDDTMPVEEVLQLTKGFYGYESFQKAAETIKNISENVC